MLNKLFLMVGLMSSVGLNCADRVEDSKDVAPAPTSPREQYVQIKSNKDLEAFTKSVVAFRGDDWIRLADPSSVYDSLERDRYRYGLKIDGHLFGFIGEYSQSLIGVPGGFEFEVTSTPFRHTFILSDHWLDSSPLLLRKVTPKEASDILMKMAAGEKPFGSNRVDIKDSLLKAKGSDEVR